MREWCHTKFQSMLDRHLAPRLPSIGAALFTPKQPDHPFQYHMMHWAKLSANDLQLFVPGVEEEENQVLLTHWSLHSLYDGWRIVGAEAAFLGGVDAQMTAMKNGSYHGVEFDNGMVNYQDPDTKQHPYEYLIQKMLFKTLFGC